MRAKSAGGAARHRIAQLFGQSRSTTSKATSVGGQASVISAPSATPDARVKRLDDLLALPCFQPAPWLATGLLSNAVESGIDELKRDPHAAHLPRYFADHVIESLDHLMRDNHISLISGACRRDLHGSLMEFATDIHGKTEADIQAMKNALGALARNPHPNPEGPSTGNNEWHRMRAASQKAALLSFERECSAVMRESPGIANDSVAKLFDTLYELETKPEAGATQSAFEVGAGIYKRLLKKLQPSEAGKAQRGALNSLASRSETLSRAKQELEAMSRAARSDVNASNDYQEMPGNKLKKFSMKPMKKALNYTFGVLGGATTIAGLTVAAMAFPPIIPMLFFTGGIAAAGAGVYAVSKFFMQDLYQQQQALHDPGTNPPHGLPARGPATPDRAAQEWSEYFKQLERYFINMQNLGMETMPPQPPGILPPRPAMLGRA